MPSPFPGMNPYLEQNDAWEDSHHDFITRAREMLSVQVGPNYYVKVERHSSLEIRDRRNRRVVTAIELLSLTNKTPGSDRDDYLRKRNVSLIEDIHFVEIDLRRGGERPGPPTLPSCDYYALVSRHEDRPKLGMWPLSIRDRLPVIPIPLSAPDPDVLLDLQAVLHRAYDAADYGKYIYGEAPEQPLSEEQLAWARQFVPQPGENSAPA